MPTDRTASGARLADARTDELRRSAVALVVLVVALGLFLWMVGTVLLAALLGVVAAVYLRPAVRWLAGRIGRPRLAAGLTLAGSLVPLVALVLYAYAELRDAGAYLERNTDAVAGRIAEAIERVPLIGGGVDDAIRGTLSTAARWGTELPAGVQSALAGFTVAASIFLFTAFYILTESDTVVAYLRESVPKRYAAMAKLLEQNVSGVLRGTVFAVFVTQAIKAGVILVLNLALGVPLPFTLALLAFVIGLFPVLGTWTVYLPAAAWLLVFRESPVRAAVMVGLGFTVSTVLISLWLRPRIGAERSHVLNFYWMFVGLVAGVYAFGPGGLVLGPLLIGVLKAAVDTVRAEAHGEPVPGDDEAPDAEILEEEKLEEAVP